MPAGTSSSAPNTLRLIGFPVMVSLAALALEVLWNILHPIAWWGQREPLIVLACLAPMFGVYFGLAASRRGAAPTNLLGGFVLAGVGVAALLPGYLWASASPYGSLNKFFWGLLLIAAGAGAQALARPRDLFRVLLAYAYAVRIPVVLIILFSMTFHRLPAYGAPIPVFSTQMGLSNLMGFLILALLPQLLKWAGFTVIMGSLFGHFAFAAVRLRAPGSQSLALRRQTASFSTLLGVVSLAAVVGSFFLISPRAPYQWCQWSLAAQVFSPLGAILAVVLGQINRHKPSLLAGYLSLLLFVPSFFSNSFPPCGEPPFPRELRVVGALRTINNSEITYASTYNTGFSQTLKQLDGTSEPRSVDAAGLIDSVLASGQKSGYAFDYRPGAPDAKGSITIYTVRARPIAGGQPNYYTDQSGLIRLTKENRPATEKDRPLE